jgi:heterodisulfide reductase subunit B
MDIGYYPGCALHGSSNDYDQSVRACLDRFGVHLREPEDWICCGASAAHSLNARLSVALPARNLGLAKREGLSELLAPCPLCSMRLHATNQALADQQTRRELEEIVELDVDGSTRILNLIEIFQRIGLERIRELVVRPLSDLRPACYYGCLLTRPPETVRFDDPEQPESMERILEALGGTPVTWNYRTECCGAGMTVANESTVLDLSHRILEDARRHGADCLVVACPMCHVNLDMKQADIERHHQTRHDLPVYYLSDLVGRALGLDDHSLGIDRHFVVKG